MVQFICDVANLHSWASFLVWVRPITIMVSELHKFIFPSFFQLRFHFPHESSSVSSFAIVRHSCCYDLWFFHSIGRFHLVLARSIRFIISVIDWLKIPSMILTQSQVNQDLARNISDHYKKFILFSQQRSCWLDFSHWSVDCRSSLYSWRRSVRMALNIRNKLGFIDGTISKPPSAHSDYDAWSCCNDIIATWLMSFVSKKIWQILLLISTAEGIWNNLISRFKQDDAPRVYDIEQRLRKIEHGYMDVSTFYTELVTLWEEYCNFVKLSVCTCSKCECDAAALWEKIQVWMGPTNRNGVIYSCSNRFLLLKRLSI